MGNAEISFGNNFQPNKFSKRKKRGSKTPTFFGQKRLEFVNIINNPNLFEFFIFLLFLLFLLLLSEPTFGVFSGHFCLWMRGRGRGDAHPENYESLASKLGNLSLKKQFPEAKTLFQLCTPTCAVKCSYVSRCSMQVVVADLYT